MSVSSTEQIAAEKMTLMYSALVGESPVRVWQTLPLPLARLLAAGTAGMPFVHARCLRPGLAQLHITLASELLKVLLDVLKGKVGTSYFLLKNLLVILSVDKLVRNVLIFLFFPFQMQCSQMARE